MAMKEYFTFPKAPGLKLHHLIQFTVILRKLILFDLKMGSYQVLPLRVKVNLGVMAASYFPKLQDLSFTIRYSLL